MDVLVVVCSYWVERIGAAFFIYFITLISFSLSHPPNPPHTHTHPPPTPKKKAHYARQRQAMQRSAATHLTGLATWDLPKAGMFVLFKVGRCRSDCRCLNVGVLEGKGRGKEGGAR